MKIKKGFVLREMCGENIVAGEGLEHINFNKLVSLNSTAAFLWKKVADKNAVLKDSAIVIAPVVPIATIPTIDTHAKSTAIQPHNNPKKIPTARIPA